jgi:ATP-dependent DNA helicase RecG
MLSLNSPVGSVPKVGPKYKLLLKNLGIETVEDLIYHFPFRYDDYSKFKKISELEEKETVSVKGVLESLVNIYTKYGKRLTIGKFTDETGSIQLIWFNQHYLKKTLLVGIEYYLSGKVTVFSGKKCFITPDLEESKERVPLNTGRLVPIYPETLGVSSKWLRLRINDVISLLSSNEFLPKEILKGNGFKDLAKSFQTIHFPYTQEDADEGRKRFAFEELFLELLNVEKRKSEWSKNSNGVKVEIFQEEIDSFIDSLPFKLTPDQTNALGEILNDLKQKHPMNRLLEGDVGTGKTIVALIASYLVSFNGLKTLYMAPTEILANQHFDTFKRFLPNLNIQLLTGIITKDEKKNRLRETTGEPDILIGTHALLFSKDKFKDVGLVIIDEQQRFGVEQRGQILEMGNNKTIPNLLSMTATPIPRTLALTLYGDLSLSVLKTHPNKLRKVTTKVVPEKKRKEIYEWVKEKNEPTFIVCPFIEGSEALGMEDIKAVEAEYYSLKKSVFSNVSMGILHGKMKSKEKLEMITKFREGEIKVLVSTPVIEVGMDIPDATIMVIESAERYGLASLHQLRGRVGRGEKEGYCFAIMSNNASGGYSRLKNLERIDNGIELAEVDLKIRGQGDVFGTMQHGYKRLKIADLSNLMLLEKVKKYAQEYYPKLNRYPELEIKLTERLGKYIPSN